MNILSIDDDALSQNFIHKVLGTEHELQLADHGQAGIEQAKRNKPDLIILDVKMPQMDGYEVCQLLKEDTATRHIPVLFLSASTSLDEQLQGYNVGATDYLLKPCEPETLRAKVRALQLYIVEQAKLRSNCAEASKTAHLALVGSSEMGLAMRFMENSYGLSEFADLADEFFMLTADLHLVCAMSFYVNDEVHSFFSDNNSSPLEIDLLNKMRSQKRIFDYGQRTFINFPNVTLLVKNMPMDDAERSGRIKDLLPMALAALSNKLYTIATEQTMRNQLDELSISFDQIKSSLLNLGYSFNANQGKSREVLKGMVAEINEFLPKLALEDDQEAYILDYIEKSTNSSLKLNENADQMNSTFHAVISKLQLLLDKQHLMLEEADHQSGHKPVQLAQVGNGVNVELF